MPKITRILSKDHVTFTYLADAFIQSDLQLHSGYTFSLVCVFPGNRTHNLLSCWRNALPLSHTGTSCSMKIFCKFPTINISKLHFLLVICLAKNFIWTTLKEIFSIFRFFYFLLFFFATSDSRFSNSCISAKYCPIHTNQFPKMHT